ncbi:homocitrate dehydratase, mitochondrial [Monosporozyma servazzii]
MLSTKVVHSKRTLASLAKIPQISNKFQSRMPPYAKLLTNLEKVRQLTNNIPLTLAEKILYSHLTNPEESLSISTPITHIRGEKYLKLSPDRVAMQDASAQMAMLQFMTTGLNKTCVPTSIHCDHLIVGKQGETTDLQSSLTNNNEVFQFLESCAQKYGITFWGPGSGIIHQIVLENYSAPGLMMLGTDSHTPNAGGLGAIAIGVGGADAVDVMTNTPWELKAPKILGIKLTGKLNGWSTPKDVITKIAGDLTVRGGTNHIIEYFGDGVNTLSSTGMATIANMGAEVGATTSIFPYQQAHKRYLHATQRKEIADAADIALNQYGYLKADQGAHYDHIIEINLSTLEPHINGPYTPDLSTSINKYGEKSMIENWPQKISVGLIGSCTNSSYQDMSRVIDLVNQAANVGLKPKIPFFVTPGSEQIRATLQRDGIIQKFEDNGAVVLANACGPCIGQWDRTDISKDSKEVTSIFTSFNRNFRARNDGNRNTMNFLTSPEIVTAMSYSGNAQFNPLKDSIKLPNGKFFKFNPPKGDELPQRGFEHGRSIFYPELDPSPNPNVQVKVSPTSDRLQLLEPFKPWNGKELKTNVLLKVEGKCTTDHISAAGVWLKYKGHLENISYNTLIGAQNKETGEINKAYDLDGTSYDIPGLMMKWKKEHRPWTVLAEHNYGEGSAREHAALSPRFLGGEIIITKSFARIHETNLKKQGMLPLTFADETDYDKIHSGDILETIGLVDMIAKDGNNGGFLDVKVTQPTGNSFIIKTKHTMSKDQINFFKAGSAINYIGEQTESI